MGAIVKNSNMDTFSEQDSILPEESLMLHRDNHGVIMDWLYYKCKELAGRTDSEFVEAARFGAKALNLRMCGDDPRTPQESLRREGYASIWRDPSQERPRDRSTIVLSNAAMITYAHYHNGYFYADAVCDRLDSFCGKWCYKADLWGCQPTDSSFPYWI